MCSTIGLDDEQKYKQDVKGDLVNSHAFTYYELLYFAQPPSADRLFCTHAGTAELWTATVAKCKSYTTEAADGTAADLIQTTTDMASCSAANTCVFNDELSLGSIIERGEATRAAAADATWSKRVYKQATGGWTPVATRVVATDLACAEQCLRAAFGQ